MGSNTLICSMQIGNMRRSQCSERSAQLLGMFSMTMRFPPLHLLFLTMLVRSATRLVALPNCHPLYKPLQLAVKRTAERHRSPLHLLFFTTGAKLNPSEITTPARRRQNYKMLDVNIEDRNTAINNAHQISGTAIFTDGSGYDKKIGATAVMMKDGKALKTLRHIVPTTLESARTLSSPFWVHIQDWSDIRYQAGRIVL